MSKQLALSIAVSVLAMVSFALLGQQAGVQLAREARSGMPVNADFGLIPGRPQFLPILN